MTFLLLSFFTLLTLLLYGMDFAFRFYSHFILSLFVHGVSGGKAFFLLLYSAGLFFLLFIRREKKGGWPLETGWVRKLLLGSVVLGMGASIGSYLYYLHTYSLPLEAHHYHFKEIYNSVNYFPHIHTSKVFIYKLGSLLGIGEALRGMDDGRVFVKVVPNYFAYVTSGSVLSVLFLSFLLVPAIVHRWKRENQTGIAILSIVAFQSVVKSLSDGGPFAYDFLVAIGTLYILIHARQHEDLIGFFKKKWKVFFWVSLGILTVECLLDPSLGFATYTFKNGSVLLGIYVLIYLVSLRVSLKHRWLKWGILSALVIFLSFAIYGRYSIYIKPFGVSLDEGTEIHYFYYKDRPLPGRLAGNQIKFDSDFLSIYSFAIEKKERVLDLYKTLGENPYRNRHVAIIHPKCRQAYGILANIVFLDFQKMETALKVPKIIDLRLKEEDLNRGGFLGEITFDPSYFPVLAHAEGGKITQLDENHKFLMYYFLNRFLYYSGIMEYILTPIGFYRFN